MGKLILLPLRLAIWILLLAIKLALLTIATAISGALVLVWIFFEMFIK